MHFARFALLSGVLAIGGCTLTFDRARLDGGGGAREDGGRVDGGRVDGGPSDGGQDTGVTRDCSPLTRGMLTQVAYRDSRCAERALQFQSASLLLESASYDVGGTARTATGQFGMVTVPYQDGYLGGSDYGTGGSGTHEWQLRGAHHAIRSTTFSMDRSRDNTFVAPLAITVHWFAAGGRDPFLYAITFDASAVAEGALQGGSWSPTGPLHFHGGAPESATMAGMAWGDRRVFRTRGDELSDAVGWDYVDAPATAIPFSMKWTLTPDAEIGLVQTETQQQHSGGDDGGGMSRRWGTSSESGLPPIGEWPYHMGQYDEIGTTSTRPTIGWGLNRGGVGYASYPEYGMAAGGATHVGHPYQSYSLFVVLGLHSESAVESAIADVAALTSTSLTTTAGTLATTAPAGVGDPTPRTLDPAGYDPRYAVYRLEADSSTGTPSVGFWVDVPSGRTLRSPVFCITGMTRARSAGIDDVLLREDQLLVSENPGAPADVACAWVTLRVELTGVSLVQIFGD